MDARENGQLASALRYDPKRDRAPKVVAAGRGELARRIIRTAEKTGVPIVSDGDLVEILAKMPLDAEIPEELYQAVSEILVFVYRLNQKFSSES